MKKILSILFLVSVGLQAGRARLSESNPTESTEKTHWGSLYRGYGHIEMPLSHTPSNPVMLRTPEEEADHKKILAQIAEEIEKHREEMLRDQKRYNEAIAEYNARFDARMAQELAEEGIEWESGKHEHVRYPHAVVSGASEVDAKRDPVQREWQKRSYRFSGKR